MLTYLPLCLVCGYEDVSPGAGVKNLRAWVTDIKSQQAGYGGVGRMVTAGVVMIHIIPEPLYQT